MPVKIKITTNPSLVKVALPYHRFNKEQLAEYLKILVEIFHKHIIDASPHDTGIGRLSIKARKRKPLEWDILIDQRFKGGKYMTAQHEGVPPSKINPILPVKKKALWWPGLPHPVKAVYHHPGIKANPFFEKGIVTAQSEIAGKTASIENELSKKFSAG